MAHLVCQYLTLRQAKAKFVIAARRVIAKYVGPHYHTIQQIARHNGPWSIAHNIVAPAYGAHQPNVQVSVKWKSLA